MKIVVVGLGYVGAPLALELAKHFDVTGFDINRIRVDELKAGKDRTNELPLEELRKTTLVLTDQPGCLRSADVVIVTVPTPITSANVPDLSPVEKATAMIGKHLKPSATVVYESTVYPGVTEDICVPILERSSNLKYGVDFWVGYSPERINPGDKVHTLTTTTKIVSGDTPETLALVDSIYSKITTTYKAQSIKIAEAAKVIENTQRDVNIALMNELAHIFSRVGVDTHDVINAACSKWNFLRYLPGFVGGHCISVDPYYLAHRSEELGYIPSLILSARKVNDSMARLVAEKTMKAINRMGIFTSPVVTILGVAFKENCPDIRNTKVVDLIREFQEWGITVQVVDPVVDGEELKHEYGISLTAEKDLRPASAVVLAVAHNQFVEDGWNSITSLVSGNCVVADVKAVLDRNTTPSSVTLVRV